MSGWGPRWLIDLLILGWALGHADLFIFSGHDSLMWRNADLPLLRLLRKRIVWVFLGSDHRPPYLNGKRVRESLGAGDAGYAAMAERARVVRTIVERIERRANVVVAMSASAQFHSRPFVHLLAVGIPHGSPAEAPDPSMAPETVGGLEPGLRLLHSPSDPAKGTDLIRGCIQELRGRGIPIDYREITGRPHREVLDAILESDGVVDQAYSDSPLAVFATEAGFRNRPALVGGYYANEIAEDVPADLIPPSRFVAPEQLCSAIEELAGDEAGRIAQGADLARFVRERWSRADVARRYLLIAFSVPPPGWWYDPARLRYLHGWGLSEEEMRHYVTQLVDRCGSSALALDQHPSLRDRLLDLARGGAAALNPDLQP